VNGNLNIYETDDWPEFEHKFAVTYSKSFPINDDTVSIGDSSVDGIIEEFVNCPVHFVAKEKLK